MLQNNAMSDNEEAPTPRYKEGLHGVLLPIRVKGFQVVMGAMEAFEEAYDVHASTPHEDEPTFALENNVLVRWTVENKHMWYTAKVTAVNGEGERRKLDLRYNYGQGFGHSHRNETGRDASDVDIHRLYLDDERSKLAPAVRDTGATLWQHVKDLRKMFKVFTGGDLTSLGNMASLADLREACTSVFNAAVVYKCGGYCKAVDIWKGRRAGTVAERTVKGYVQNWQQSGVGKAALKKYLRRSKKQHPNEVKDLAKFVMMMQTAEGRAEVPAMQWKSDDDSRDRWFWSIPKLQSELQAVTKNPFLNTTEQKMSEAEKREELRQRLDDPHAEEFDADEARRRQLKAPRFTSTGLAARKKQQELAELRRASSSSDGYTGRGKSRDPEPAKSSAELKRKLQREGRRNISAVQFKTAQLGKVCGGQKNGGARSANINITIIDNPDGGKQKVEFSTYIPPGEYTHDSDDDLAEGTADRKRKKRRKKVLRDWLLVALDSLGGKVSADNTYSSDDDASEDSEDDVGNDSSLVLFSPSQVMPHNRSQVKKRKKDATEQVLDPMDNDNFGDDAMEEEEEEEDDFDYFD